MLSALRSVFLAVLAAFVLAGGVLAQGAPAPSTGRSENVEIELASGVATAAPGAIVPVALVQTIRDKWHTYWRNPGDSGTATEIAWTLPAGVTAGPIEWATPMALPFGPLVNYGYEGTVVLPVAITVPKDATPGAELRLTADVAWLECADICIPAEATVSLPIRIAATTTPDGTWGPRIEAARAALPRPFDGAARVTIGNGVAFTASGGALAGVTAATFFPYSGTLIDHAAPQRASLGDGGLRIDLTISPVPVPPPAAGATEAGVLVLGEGANLRAFEVSATVGPPLDGAGGRPLAGAPATAAGGEAPLTLPLALLFAFLGGLILNLMPCVFPVLSLKALSLAHGAQTGTARRHGLLFLAGVMATFLTLAGLLIGLQAAGAGQGWGFQLQEPLFVGALALLFFAIGLNLLGVFEIGGSLQNLGGGLAGKSGDAGSFFTGALAVTAATPCTAPFMAGALGFAASQPPAVSLAVFAALGLGFALPMTALAFAPGLQKLLPKPGVWMDRLKQAFAFPMFGAAVWLAWVLTAQSGADGLLVLLTVAVALGLALWGLATFRRPMSRAITAGIALAAAAGVAMAMRPVPGLEPEPWSPQRVAALTTEGKGVFVNFTADWCVSCKVNERVALSSPDVAKAFADAGVTYLKGDWTNRDETIAAELAAHGRTGVPLYLYYAPGSTTPVVLPQLLTPGIVTEALKGAPAG